MTSIATLTRLICVLTLLGGFVVGIPPHLLREQMDRGHVVRTSVVRGDTPQGIRSGVQQGQPAHDNAARGQTQRGQAGRGQLSSGQVNRGQDNRGHVNRNGVIRGDMPREQGTRGGVHQEQPAHDHVARGQTQREQADRRQLTSGQVNRGHVNRNGVIRGDMPREQGTGGGVHQEQPAHDHVARGQTQGEQADRRQLTSGHVNRGHVNGNGVVRGDTPREQGTRSGVHQEQPVHDHVARGQTQREQADRRQLTSGHVNRGHVNGGQGVRGRAEQGQMGRRPRQDSGMPSRTNTSQLPVVFPDELRPRLNGFGVPDCAMTAGLGNLEATDMDLYSFCDNDTSYPTEVVRMAMREVNVDLSDNTLLGRQPLNHEESIDQRVCETKRRTIYPKTARNADREWVYVINDVEYAQAVTTEVCAKEDSQCEFVSLPSGYTSGCRQKFANRKLLALHPTERKAYADSFLFPSCCVCYVRAPPLRSRTFRGRG